MTVMTPNADLTLTNDAIQPLLPGDLASLVGDRANKAAAASRFAHYRTRRAEQTLRRQDSDLMLFREFLAVMGLRTGDLSTNPQPGVRSPGGWLKHSPNGSSHRDMPSRPSMCIFQR